ncbi:MAG: aspartate--tRNA ligase [Bacteroidales bacterium]|nr:aspartate--tRNA ligase [Bacteroidales bacterium]MCF8337592.1 aspartate--tRNA ligase [Bacteroidales bacterium]
MLRTHTCGELRLENENEEVTLTGWIQRSRDLGGMTFVDLRDRYGITQLVFDVNTDRKLAEKARKMGREFVIQVKGKVAERSNKNQNISTGDIEILADSLTILNKSKVPPFTIEDETDGGEELRMKYRYLDLRRQVNQDSIVLRHQMSIETKKYLNDLDFVEIETPYLIKSTPEGARDFVVPSRLNKGAFYALPQSPQTFKQLLMISGYDKYFQLVKCFRDEDFRSDRQPEFTQIDCEMSFVEQDDVLQNFEGLAKHLFKQIKNIDVDDFPRMSYEEAIRLYGSDKPDLRFGMQFVELNDVARGKGFKVFDNAELVVGINAEGCAGYTRKQLDGLTDFVTKPQIGAKGLVYLKYNEDGSFKSSVDKFFSQEDLKAWVDKFEAKPGDLMLILAGDVGTTRTALSELRLEMGNQLGLRDPKVFRGLWVVDFPLLEWDEETKRYQAMHHPFTSPKDEDIHLLEESPEKVRANAYDMVINGVEIGGGSIRIHDRELQDKMFSVLGFSKEEAQQQFGFLLEAFDYGAPPHGGIAFGFDRWVALFAGRESIRDVIAFPKNNAGRDIMIDSPSTISEEQLKELNIQIRKDEKQE